MGCGVCCVHCTFMAVPVCCTKCCLCCVEEELEAGKFHAIGLGDEDGKDGKAGKDGGEVPKSQEMART